MNLEKIFFEVWQTSPLFIPIWIYAKLQWVDILTSLRGRGFYVKYFSMLKGLRLPTLLLQDGSNILSTYSYFPLIINCADCIKGAHYPKIYFLTLAIQIYQDYGCTKILVEWLGCWYTAYDIILHFIDDNVETSVLNVNNTPKNL